MSERIHSEFRFRRRYGEPGYIHPDELAERAASVRSRIRITRPSGAAASTEFVERINRALDRILSIDFMVSLLDQVKAPTIRIYEIPGLEDETGKASRAEINTGEVWITTLSDSFYLSINEQGELVPIEQSFEEVLIHEFAHLAGATFRGGGPSDDNFTEALATMVTNYVGITYFDDFTTRDMYLIAKKDILGRYFTNSDQLQFLSYHDSVHGTSYADFFTGDSALAASPYYRPDLELWDEELSVDDFFGVQANGFFYNALKEAVESGDVTPAGFVAKLLKVRGYEKVDGKLVFNRRELKSLGLFGEWGFDLFEKIQDGEIPSGFVKYLTTPDGEVGVSFGDDEQVHKLTTDDLEFISPSRIGTLVTGDLRVDNLGNQSPPDEIISSVYGQIGANLGLLIANGGSAEEGIGNGTPLVGMVSGSNISGTLSSNPAGTLSSLLGAELAEAVNEALGIDGNSTGEQILQFGVQTVLDRVVVQPVQQIIQTVFENFNLGLPSINPLAVLLGSKLGSLIVSPQTQAAAVLSSAGAVVGAGVGAAIIGTGSTAAAASLGAQIGAFAVPVIGAAIGFVLGALIGNLFGKKKPKIPTADASTVLNFSNGYYQLGTVNSTNSGNEDFVSDMANSAAIGLNAFIDVVKDGDPDARVINTTSPTQIYGHDGNQVYVTIGGTRHNVINGNDAVDKGTMYALTRTEIAGGNLYMKRAAERTTAQNLITFAGDLQVAENFALYQSDQEMIDAAIAAPWESLSASDKSWYNSNKAVLGRIQRQGHQALNSTDQTWYNNNKTRVQRVLNTLNSTSTFAAGWIVTLQRAAELGLNKSAESDFYGGMKGFADSLQGIINQPFNYEDLVLYVRGDDLEVYYDTDGNGSAHSSYDDLIFDETGFLRSASHADGGVGYHRALSNSEMTGGNDIIFNVSGTVDDQTTTTVTTEDRWIYNARLGEWVFIPGTTTTTTTEGGDDIMVGNSGTNTFYGRSGDDWLDGGSGTARDNLYGGDDNDVLLGRGGDDYLYGENGDDVIYGGDGYDRIWGGNGNDILVQGSGTGVVRGQGGDDTLILTQSSGYGGHYRGGSETDDNGNDTVSFERFSQGIKLDMSYRPGSWDTHSNAFYRHEATRRYNAYANDGSGSLINFFYISQIDNVTGTAFADELIGDSQNNILRGGAGDDILDARAGGSDVLEGGAGADRLISSSGWNGSDTISYEHSQGGVDVSIQSQSALGGQHAFGGDASGDVFEGYFNNLIGSQYSDVLEGHHNYNKIEGGDGDDYIIVTRGPDQYYGGDGFDTVDFGNHKGSNGLSINGTNGVYTLGYNNGVNGEYDSTPSNNGVRMYDVEHVVGTDKNDTIRFGAGDNVLEGGKGVDTLYGGAGNDIYFVEFGGGNDQIYEYGNQGHDTIMVGYEDGLSWDDVTIGAGTNLTVSVAGQGTLATAYNSPNSNRELVGVDAIDIGGVGAIDVWYITGGAWRPSGSGTAPTGGTNYNDVLKGYGDARGLSILQGFNGNDTIYSAMTTSSTTLQYETNANIMHGGRGNDTLWASVGDDQYIFDRGSGRDAIYDSGGLDHIQFGPGVSASDVIFEVIGSNLYIGIAPEGTEDTSTLRASQMADRMTIVGGGSVSAYSWAPDTIVSYSGNLLEYITVENINMDIRTLDIDWTVNFIPFNFGPFFPVAFDLDGDGLDMVSILESEIVIRGEGGRLTRIGWLGGDDGFLALDRNGDGEINSLSEISFVGDLEGATTDLEGLRAYDSNEDGVFDASDERWGEFTVWRDLNQNGKSGENELMTLEEAGITSINLTLQTTGNDVKDFADNAILNTADYTRADGTTGTAYDVALAASVIRDGRESEVITVGSYDGSLDDNLGRISTRRIEMLEARMAEALGNDEPVDGKTTFEHMALTSDWGRLVGHRSPLLDRIYAEEAAAEAAELEGMDTGRTQAELLAEFETSGDVAPGVLTQSSPVTSSVLDGGQVLLAGGESQFGGGSYETIKYTPPGQEVAYGELTSGSDTVKDSGPIKPGMDTGLETIKTGEALGQPVSAGAQANLSGDLDVSGIESWLSAVRAHWEAKGFTSFRDFMDHRIAEMELQTSLTDGYRRTPFEGGALHRIDREVMGIGSLLSEWFGAVPRPDNDISSEQGAALAATRQPDEAFALDRFLQAMAGFGGTGAFAGLKPLTDTEEDNTLIGMSGPRFLQSGPPKSLAW